jgi:hypothetical protein
MHVWRSAWWFAVVGGGLQQLGGCGLGEQPGEVVTWRVVTCNDDVALDDVACDFCFFM